MALKDLMTRYEGNPILTFRDYPGAEAVFNCGATKFGDKYILLVSISSPGFPGCGKQVHVAESDDGINFTIREESFISPADEGPYTDYDYDLCDPRVTYLEGTYYVTYPAHECGQGVIGILGKTEDFRTYERMGVIALPSNRVPVLFPEKVGDYYVRLDRPFGIYAGSMWISYSKDLLFWGKHKALFGANSQYWRSMKVGPGGPPIKTDKGWLVIYHAVSGAKVAAMGYRLSCILLDLEDPGKIIGMPKEYLICPQEEYERVGFVPNVIFTCGQIVESDGEMKLYYGAADTCIGMATANVNELADACLKAGV